MQIKKRQLLQLLSYLFILSQLFHFSHADVGTAAQYSPPYLREYLYIHKSNLSFENYYNLEKIYFTFQCFHSDFLFVYFFRCEFGYNYEQRRRAMVMIKPSFHQAICSQQLEMGYGTMELRAEGNTW